MYMNKKQRKKEKQICGNIYQFLIDQIIGLIEIDIGNYLYEKANFSLHFDRWTNGGLDVYIFDPNYCTVDKWNKIEFNDDYIDDILMIEHLHEEDMLWFILNYQQEKKKMIEKVDKYLKYNK